MPKHLKKITEETIHENPWWTYKHDTYEKPNGEVGDYYYASLKDAVVIIPILADNRIGLVIQYRYLSERTSTEFPCGGSEGSESILEAAQKELLEETGYTAEKWVNIGSFYPSNGLVKQEAQVFLAYVTAQGEQDLDDTEEMDVITRRPDEIEEMIQRNEIRDGFSLSAWSLVRHYFVA